MANNKIKPGFYLENGNTPWIVYPDGTKEAFIRRYTLAMLTGAEVQWEWTKDSLNYFESFSEKFELIEDLS